MVDKHYVTKDSTKGVTKIRLRRVLSGVGKLRINLVVVGAEGRLILVLPFSTVVSAKEVAY